MICVPAEFKAISDTLFLPLYVRALETLRKDSLFKDPPAVNLVSEIDYDFSRFACYDLLHTVVALRVRAFDRWVAAFVAQKPDAVIVNLGCGLDTRFQRLDNGFLNWYDMDLPEVIAFRQRFFKPTLRYRYIAGSVLDENNLAVPASLAPDRLLFLAEGLFPYFCESQVQSLVSGLNRQFPGAMLIFDAVSSVQVLLNHLNPAFYFAGVNFKWGLDRAESLETWAPGLRVAGQAYYFDQPEPRLGAYRLLRLLPHIRYGFSVVALRFGPGGS